MKITDLIYFKEQLGKEEGELFQKDNIIEGKILELDGDYAKIFIRGFGLIRAKHERILSECIGEDLHFIVKEFSAKGIYLKAIPNDNEQTNSNSISSNKEGYLKNILKEFNLRHSPASKEILESLMEFSMTINKESLVDSLTILDKLIQMLNVKEGESIALIKSNDEKIDVWELDIRNLMLAKEDTMTMESKYELVGEEFNKGLRQFEGHIFKEHISRDLLQSIVFFMKYDIKPTLKNLNYFLNINENHRLLSKDLEMYKKNIDKKFTNYLKRIMISIGGLKETNSNLYMDYKEVLDEALTCLKNNNDISGMYKGIEREKMADRIEFLKEMNDSLVFIYLPLSIDDNNQDTLMLLADRRKKNRYKDKKDIYINLDTQNFGNIRIYCQVYSFNINIKVIGIKEKDIDLFKSNEDELKAMVRDTGYSIGAIDYISRRNYTLVDSLNIHSVAKHSLDVQV